MPQIMVDIINLRTQKPNFWIGKTTANCRTTKMANTSDEIEIFYCRLSHAARATSLCRISEQDYAQSLGLDELK